MSTTITGRIDSGALPLTTMHRSVRCGEAIELVSSFFGMDEKIKENKPKALKNGKQGGRKPLKPSGEKVQPEKQLENKANNEQQQPEKKEINVPNKVGRKNNPRSKKSKKQTKFNSSGKGPNSQRQVVNNGKIPILNCADYRIKRNSSDFALYLLKEQYFLNTPEVYDVPSFRKDRCFSSAFAYLQGYSFDEIRDASKTPQSWLDFKVKLSSLLSLDKDHQMETEQNFTISPDNRKQIDHLRAMLLVHDIDLYPLHDKAMMQDWYGAEPFAVKSDRMSMYLVRLTVKEFKEPMFHVLCSKFVKGQVIKKVEVQDSEESVRALYKDFIIEEKVEEQKEVLAQQQAEVINSILDQIEQKDGPLLDNINRSNQIELQVIPARNVQQNVNANVALQQNAVVIRNPAPKKLYSRKFESLAKCYNADELQGYICATASWQDAYDFVMQFKPQYQDCEVCIHYNKTTINNAMCLFYCEADVRIVEQRVGRTKAIIDFGAFTLKGSHVKNRVKSQVLTLYAKPGPMDYVTKDCPVVVQIGANLSLALSVRRCDVGVNGVQYKNVATVSLEDGTIYTARSDYLNWFGSAPLSREYKTNKQKFPQIENIRMNLGIFCEVTDTRTFLAFDPYIEIQMLAVQAITMSELQMQVVDEYCQVKKIQRKKSKGCLSWISGSYKKVTYNVKLLLGYKKNNYTIVQPEVQNSYSLMSDADQPIFGCDQIKSTSVHHVDQKYYNENYNKFVLRDFRVYTVTGNRLERGFYDYWKDYCQCHTNTPRETLFPTDGSQGFQFYQFATCPLNSIAALLGRQAASKLFPKPRVLDNFGKFVRKHWLMKIPNFYQNINFDQYIEHVRETDVNKAKKYTYAYSQFILGVFCRIRSNIFVKVNEWNICSIDQDPLSQGTRSRCINDVEDQIKAIGGLINYNCLKALRACAVSYGKEFYLGYYDNNEKAQIIYNEYRTYKRPVFVSNDGSSHDSNQHYELLKMIDVPIVSQITDLVAQTEGWGQAQTAQAQKIGCDLDMAFNVYAKINGKRIRQMSGVLHGTVYSGHPTRTTFGNSVRVYLYTDYIMHLAGIQKYKIWVCGDDMLAIIEEEDVEKFQDSFWQVYSLNKVGVHGLGQCSKGMELRRDGMCSFLSLNFIMDDCGGRCFRNLPRFQVMQTGSSSKVLNREQLKQCMEHSIYLSGEGLECVYSRYKPQFLSAFDKMLAKVHGWYKATQVQNALTNGYSSRDQQLFERVSYAVGDVAGAKNLAMFRQSYDISVYHTLSGKWERDVNIVNCREQEAIFNKSNVQQALL